MNLETNYQLNKSRLEKEKDLKTDLELLKSIPYKEISNNGWIEEETNGTKKVYNLREYFAVSNLSLIKPSYAVAFRQHKEVKEISDFGVFSWLRRAEIKGLENQVDTFDKTRLKELIPKFRELTMKSAKEFYPVMKELCAECGISLVLVKYIPKTYICGATIWRNNKPIIAMSIREKRADVFWFTFFHEIAHLLKHSKKDLHISYDKDHDEDEADEMASNYLIPKELYTEFVANYNYSDQTEIKKFSKKIGIASYILIGRLQHDSLISYKNFNHLIPSFEIKSH